MSAIVSFFVFCSGSSTGPTQAGQPFERAFTESNLCDAMLVVGTSGLVQPAASLPMYARRAGIIEVNPNRSDITWMADIFLPGPAGQVLPKPVDALAMTKT